MFTKKVETPQAPSLPYINEFDPGLIREAWEYFLELVEKGRAAGITVTVSNYDKRSAYSIANYYSAVPEELDLSISKTIKY